MGCFSSKGSLFKGQAPYANSTRGMCKAKDKHLKVRSAKPASYKDWSWAGKYFLVLKL